MPGIDPVTGLPLDLITPNPAGAPPGFVQQFDQAPLPGATPLPGASLPPGFVAAPPAPAQVAPVPNLYQPLPQPPAPPQAAPAPVQAPPRPSHHAPGMVQDFDKQINAAQLQQQSAAAGLSSTQREGADAVAAAQGQQADQRLKLAGELAAKQAEVQAHNKQLDAIDAANLAKARDATIPDFWKGRTGALIGSTIAVALSGVGAGLLGSTKNTAQEAIQHNVDQYFHNQKERIDNLYKYAEAQGKLDQQTRLNYANDLLNLKDQHSYVMQSAADKVNEIATKSKGAADAAMTNFLASKLLEQAIKDKQDVRELRSKMMLQEAQAAAARGSAAESEARAKQGGYLTPAQTMGMITQLTGQFKHVSDPKTGLAAHVRELGGKLKAVADDPNNPLNTVALADSMIKSNTGKAAIMSQYNLLMGHAAGSGDTAEQVIEKFRTGNASPQQRAALVGSAQQVYNNMTTEAGEANKQFHEAVAANPALNNPMAQGVVAGQERAIFGGFPNYGKQETVLAPGQTAPTPGAAPAQGKPKTITTPDKVVHYLQPDGSYN